MVSGSGRFMRNMILEPEINCYIVEVGQTGKNYRICWGLVKGGRPTGKLPTHLMSHGVKMKATEGRYRVIYHTHSVSIVTLAFVPSLTDEVFTRELWETATGCPVAFPAGVGVVGWTTPDGRSTTVATSRLMGEYDAAVWAYHGLPCAGGGFDLILSLTYTIERSVEILIKVLSVRSDKLQAITPQELRNLAVGFHVNLPEKFLYEKQAESGRLKRQR